MLSGGTEVGGTTRQFTDRYIHCITLYCTALHSTYFKWYCFTLYQIIKKIGGMEGVAIYEQPNKFFLRQQKSIFLIQFFCVRSTSVCYKYDFPDQIQIYSGSFFLWQIQMQLYLSNNILENNNTNICYPIFETNTNTNIFLLQKQIQI